MTAAKRRAYSCFRCPGLVVLASDWREHVAWHTAKWIRSTKENV